MTTELRISIVFLALFTLAVLGLIAWGMVSVFLDMLALCRAQG